MHDTVTLSIKLDLLRLKCDMGQISENLKNGKYGKHEFLSTGRSQIGIHS